jgi:hypothetical protein
MYKRFVDKVLSKYGRTPSNQEVGEFLFIFGLLNNEVIYNNYIRNLEPEEAKKAESVAMFIAK